MDVRQTLFRYRSYTPIPFLLLMVYFAQPAIQSFVIGFVIVAGGELLRLWGVSIAGSETRTTGPVGGTYLITIGPFAHVRNPLYLGNMVMYTGMGVMSNALFPWLMVIAVAFFFLQYSLIVSLEEEHMASAFGEEFRRYRSAVPKFVPRLVAYKGGSGSQPRLDWKRGLQSERRTLQAITLVVLTITILWMLRG